MLKLSSSLPIFSVMAMFALLGSACSDNTSPNTANAATPEITQKTTTTSPASTGELSDVAAALQTHLTQINLNSKVLGVHPTDMPDIYLAQVEGMPPVFTDKTGSYLFQGEIISLAKTPSYSVSDKAIGSIAKTALAAVDKKEMIVFSPKDTPKTAIHVFTDPTCQYCQLLHRDIEKLTAAGIEVRYLAWPRHEQAVTITEAVWCSSDPKKALTDAKQGRLPHPTTCSSPVSRHSELGTMLGVSGTPALFLGSGEKIGGYVPADELIQLALANPN